MGFRPDRWDITGAPVCLARVLAVMYAPRSRWLWAVTARRSAASITLAGQI